MTVFPEVLHKLNSYILDPLEGTSGVSPVMKLLELKQGAEHSWGPGKGLIL